MNAPRTAPKFPVGGPRQPVYAFLQSQGFIMDKGGDKHYTRADGVWLHLYGAGSMARIYAFDGTILADGSLADAIAALGDK